MKKKRYRPHIENLADYGVSLVTLHIKYSSFDYLKNTKRHKQKNKEKIKAVSTF